MGGGLVDHERGLYYISSQHISYALAGRWKILRIPLSPPGQV